MVAEYGDEDRDVSFILSSLNKSWYTAARPLIYRRITVRREERLAELEKYIQQNPIVAAWIRVLRIDHHFRDKWLLDVPRILKPILPKLQTIEIGRISHTPVIHKPTFFHDLSSFDSVHKLIVERVNLEWEFTNALACAFPNLKVLHFRKLNREHYDLAEKHANMHAALDAAINWQPPPSIPLPILHNPRFEEVIVAPEMSDYGVRVCGWLKKTETPKSIRTFRYHILSTKDFESLGMFLSEVRSNLQHLHLSIKDSVTRPSYTCRLFMDPWYQLNKLTGLCHLRLSHPGFMRFFLAHLPSPLPVEFVTFDISFKKLEQFKNGENQAVDARLAGSQFPELRRVRFEYSGPVEYDAVWAKIRKVYKKLCEREVVVLVKVGDEVQ
ncbi:unnamed protein product [Somion occarium]|uniref:Uncharacterized protein n=1 Tax=Somion occarium TaxID=3059160 RepID=A0ABP1DWG2_9APHY